MSEIDLKEIDQLLHHHIGIMSESLQHKLDIVVEGHHMLSESWIEWKSSLTTGLKEIPHYLEIASF